MTETEHDTITIAAIAALAFICADMSHEALGHGVAAWLLGNRYILLSYTYLTTGSSGHRLLAAAGPVVNLAEGLVSLALLRFFTWRSLWSFFLFGAMTYSLLDAAAYLVYSGVSNSGDLGVVIAGLPYLNVIRATMVVAGALLYWGATVVCGRQLARFSLSRGKLTLVMYATPLILMCAAAMLNPLGLHLFLISALPTTALANLSLFRMPAIAAGAGELRAAESVVTRSWEWAAAGTAAVLLFVFVVGPGVVLKDAR